MAKNSGSVRRSSSQGTTQVDSGLTPAMQDSIASVIAKGGYTEFSREQANAWYDMTLDEKLSTLQQANFTGLINRDELDGNGNILVPIGKEQIISEFQDALANEMGFNGMADDITFTVGYKDGSRKYLSYMENDFEEAGITRTTTPRSAWDKAKKALHLRDVAYIMRSDGYAEPNYWIAKDIDSKQLLRNYGGFEEWENGKLIH